MMPNTNWGLHRRYYGEHHTDRDAAVAEARADFMLDAPLNPAWMIATVRGVQIGMLVKASDAPEEKWFNAPYDADIKIGDILTLNGYEWLCTKLSNTDDVTLKGFIKQCNLNLQFQLNDSTIHSAWCVFDSGVYSTTLHGGKYGDVGAQQFKAYLPYNEETRCLQRDKRLATEILYYPDGSKHLRCYKVTANDSVNGAFGEGRYIDLKLIEDLDSSADNVDLMICDYIAPDADLDKPGGGRI